MIVKSCYIVNVVNQVNVKHSVQQVCGIQPVILNMKNSNKT